MLPNTKYTLKILPKTEYFAKVTKFRQIWSLYLNVHGLNESSFARGFDQMLTPYSA